MDPITLGLLIGAGTGLLKSQAVDVPAAQRQAKLQAEIAKMSPWSKMQPDVGSVTAANQAANPFSSMLQFGSTGALIGQGLDQSNNMKGLNNALAGSTTPNALSTPVSDQFVNPGLDANPGVSDNPYSFTQNVQDGGAADVGTAGTTSPAKFAKLQDSWTPPPMPAQYMPGNNYNFSPWSLKGGQ